MDAAAVLPDRVVDAVPTALLAAAVLAVIDVTRGGTTAPTALLASFALDAAVVLVGVVAVEWAWDRIAGRD